MKARQASGIEVSVHEAAAAASPEMPLIDIRSSLQQRVGVPEGAVSMSAEDVLGRLQERELQPWSGAYVLCAQGVRSRELVQQLSDLGISSAFSVAGGYRAWTEAGLASEYQDGLNAGQAERYARHLVIPQVGPAGQSKLLRSRILLVGLGGLNSPVALYLAAAGVGTLGLVDDDKVERSNLQRQIIHRDKRTGQMKTRSTAASIRSLNPETGICVFEKSVDAGNAESLVKDWDVVIDGTDNFPARYALNNACVAQGIPLVYGALMRFQGQASVFWPAAPEQASISDRPCFQCLLPSAPSREDAPACAEAGVLGVLPGIVGTLQATEALKLVLQIGQPLIGRLLMFDALSMDFRQTRIKRKPDCPCCGQRMA